MGKNVRAACISRSKLISMLLLLAILTGFSPFGSLSGNLYGGRRTLTCSVCGKKLRPGSTYIKSKGRVFCSERCLKSTLPKCSKCGRQSSHGFKQNGKFYCSKECLSSTWPQCSACGVRTPGGVVVGGSTGKFFCQKCATKPRCFCCAMPGECHKLSDGRYLCEQCKKAAVFDRKEAEAIFTKVRKLLKDKFNLSTDHPIDFSLVDIKTLDQRSPNHSHGVEMGLFIHEENYEKTTTTSYSVFKGKSKTEKVRKVDEKDYILVLYGLSKKKFTEVVAHELGHDWMQANFPKISDLKVKEGWAEYVAYLVNKYHGHDDLISRMSENQDPVYGAGFRAIKKLGDEKGFKGVLQFLEKKNK